MLTYLGGIFLGWGLGANDAANVFGTAVSSRMIRWGTAALLGAIFVVAGATLQGAAGARTLGGLTSQTPQTALLTVFAAGLTVALMTFLRLPISTSQAVVGSIVGIGLVQGHVDLGGLTKILLCWLGTPLGGIMFYVVFHALLKGILRVFRPSVFVQDPLFRLGLVLVGCYGAYALGANNVGNVAGVFVAAGLMPMHWAVLLGAVSIAAGILSFSKPVMLTVGRSIVEISPFSALAVILAEAATVHVYAVIGVPVSTSQAVVGALLGISLVRGLQVVHWRALARVTAGWLATPFVAALLALLLYFLTHLRFQS